MFPPSRQQVHNETTTAASSTVNGERSLSQATWMSTTTEDNTMFALGSPVWIVTVGRLAERQDDLACQRDKLQYVTVKRPMN
jgi:hypothetical protein